jgi:YgiT-type zinc finger domain-containing protein
MKCIVCHHGDTKPGTTTLTFDRANSTIVVRSVPAEVCENCGEAYVAEDVTASVLAFVREARESAPAVLIRDFTPAAA